MKAKKYNNNDSGFLAVFITIVKTYLPFFLRILPASLRRCITLAFLLLSSTVYAQQLPFAHLSIADGLEDTVIFAIEQDKQGFLWIATRTGINRFDGDRFWTYGQNDGLPNNLARDILNTRAGRLWIASERGIAWFDGKKFQTLTDWPKNVSARVIKEAADGSLWVATYGAGLLHISAGQSPQILETFDRSSGLPSNRVRSLLVDNKGNVWIGMSGNIARISQGQVQTIQWHARRTEIRTFYQHSDNEIWVGTRHGIFHFVDGRFLPLDLGMDLSKQTINTIKRDSKNTVLIGTRDFGVYQYNVNGQVKHLDMKDGLPDNSVNSIFQDNEGNLWFGTYGGGIARLSTSKVLNWKAQKGLPNPNVYAITDDHTGCIWIGTNGDGVSRLCNQELTHYTRDDGLPHNKILSAMIDHNGTPWFGTLQGISHLQDGEFINYDQDNGLSGSVSYHLIQARDKTIWIATNNGLNRFVDGKIVQFRRIHGLPDHRINHILESKNGDLWIGSANGLIRYHQGKFSNWTTEDGLPANFINDFYEDEKGGLWIATNNGLSYFYNGVFKNWRKEQGLPHNNCTVILPGKNDEIWIGTSRGVAIFDGNDFTVITAKEGLVFDLVNRGAGYRDPEGNIWFGTGEGMSRFAADFKPGDSNPPPVHLLSISNNQTQLAIDDIAQIPQQDSSLHFNYSAISFQRAPDVNFRYRLDNGGSSKWRETRLRDLQINSLAAGEYTFEVTARIGNGQWNDAPAVYKFRVTPPFWKTTW
ncbi:MAG TPA: hypothetical protein ENJ41_02150, partial [Oceanospirillales bacterium]|nr:hypothetical protein [Oceanospirillales bacterium]